MPGAFETGLCVQSETHTRQLFPVRMVIRLYHEPISFNDDLAASHI